MRRIHKIKEKLHPIREALLDHPIYDQMTSLESLRIFMEYHVFAVWDFMSLLKCLQQELCCLKLPWLPSLDPRICRYINEIVLAEESDCDGKGGFSSHFELYLQSMRKCGAATEGIDGFIKDLRGGASVKLALSSPAVPPACRSFVEQTFQIIQSENPCAIASAFTFGRENLLPDVFQCIVEKLKNEAAGQLDDLQFYLNRHIAVDRDDHGPKAFWLVESLCGSDCNLWNLVESTGLACLNARKNLWDEIFFNITSKCF